MKRILFIVLLSGCSLNRLSDRIEIPSNQVWDLYTDLHVIKVDSLKRYQRITAIPYGKSYPKYSYQWHDKKRTIRVGDVIPLSDSLRGSIDYKHHWKISRIEKKTE